MVVLGGQREEREGRAGGKAKPRGMMRGRVGEMDKSRERERERAGSPQRQESIRRWLRDGVSECVFVWLEFVLV